MKPTKFRYQCATCDEWHEGVPAFIRDYPSQYFTIPVNERGDRVEMTSDTCIIDKKWFYVLGNVNIPVRDLDDPLIFGQWVSLSENSFKIYQDLYERTGRENQEPVFAWLTGLPPIYPNAQIKTMLHFQPYPNRPYLELYPDDHPMAVDQRNGITIERLTEIVKTLYNR